MTNPDFISCTAAFYRKTFLHYRSVCDLEEQETTPPVDRRDVEHLLKQGEAFYSRTNCSRETSTARSWIGFLASFYKAALYLINAAYEGRPLQGEVSLAPDLDGRMWPEKITAVLDTYYVFQTLSKIEDDDNLLDRLPELFNYVHQECYQCRGFQTEQLVLLVILESWYTVVRSRFPRNQLMATPTVTRVPFAAARERRIPLNIYTSAKFHQSQLLATSTQSIKSCSVSGRELLLEFGSQPMSSPLIVTLSTPGFESCSLEIPVSTQPMSTPRINEESLKQWREEYIDLIKTSRRGVIAHFSEGNLQGIPPRASWFTRGFPAWTSEPMNASCEPSFNTLVTLELGTPSEISKFALKSPIWNVSVIGFLEWQFPGFGGTDSSLKRLLNLTSLASTSEHLLLILNRIGQTLADPQWSWYLDERAFETILAKVGDEVLQIVESRLEALDPHGRILLRVILEATEKLEPHAPTSLGEISRFLINRPGIQEVRLKELLDRIDHLDKIGLLEVPHSHRYPPKYRVPKNYRHIAKAVLESQE